MDRGFRPFAAALFAMSLLGSISLGSSWAESEAATPLLDATVDALPAPPVMVDLSRLEVAPGAGLELTVPGPEFYVVEAGTIGIRVDGTAYRIASSESAAPGTQEELSPGVDHKLEVGDQVVVMPDVPHSLTNDSSAPVSLLNTVIFPASSAVPSWLPSATLPNGVSSLTLAADIAAELPDGRSRVTVARFALGNQGTPSPSPAVETTPIAGTADLQDEIAGDAPFTLIVVESGELVVRRGGAGEDRYRTGDVVRLDPRASATLTIGSAEPLTVIVLTVGLADPVA